MTTHLRLTPRLRMSGAIPLLLLFAFMVWTGTKLRRTLINNCRFRNKREILLKINTTFMLSFGLQPAQFTG